MSQHVKHENLLKPVPNNVMLESTSPLLLHFPPVLLLVSTSGSSSSSKLLTWRTAFEPERWLFDCWHQENKSWTQGLGKRTTAIVLYIISEGLCRTMRVYIYPYIQRIVNIRCIYIHGGSTMYIILYIMYCIRKYVKSESQVLSIATNTANDAIQQLISCLISSVAPAYDLIFHRQCMAMLSGSFMGQPFLHPINSAKNDLRTSKGDG